MLWHGKIRLQNFNLSQYKRSRLLKKRRKDGIRSLYNYRMHTVSTIFYVPGNWETLIFKNTKTEYYTTMLCSDTYFFQLLTPAHLKRFNFDNNTSTLFFTSYYVGAFYRTYWKNLLNVFTAIAHPFFKKLKFKGKGYYIFKNYRNTVTPQFGYAHRLYVYSFYTSVKFLSKTSIIVFGILKKDVELVALQIKRLRVINIFTGRGVRFSKQVIYKKVGKVSSYR